MAVKFYARVKDTTTSTGAGTFTCSGSPPAGFRTFSSKLVIGDLFYYCIEQQVAGEWEVGMGRWLGTHQFDRILVTGSSNSDTIVTFSAGTKNVFMTVPGDFLNEIWTNGRIFAARMGCDMP
jgi:hypothetical protein